MSATLEVRSDRFYELLAEYMSQAAEEGRREAPPEPSRRRLPFEPLRHEVERLGGFYRFMAHRLDGAQRARLSRAWERAQVSGVVTIAIADQFAIELFGVHPFEIWGDAWFE